MSEAKQVIMKVSLAAQRQSVDAVQALSSFKGPKGEKGDKGDRGETGAAGSPGPAGADATDEQVAAAVTAYLTANPPDIRIHLRTDATLMMQDGVLSVHTADAAEADNTLPITSSAVHAAVGNIDVLLQTI